MSDNLIIRLKRGFGSAAGRAEQVRAYEVIALDAANRISELERENAELRAKIKRMRPVAALVEFVRPQVLAFAKAMEIKLRENDYKGGWKACSIEWLLTRASEELNELAGVRSLGEMALAEAADVANFCMMIADNIKPVVEIMHDYESKDKS